MAQQREIGGRAAADLVLRLSRAALGEGFVEALTSAQWMALRYFSRANRFSRTVSAFAEFHATTRGTASQTVKGLIKQGYLARIPSDTDGRSARVDPTDNAKAILARDPFQVVVDAAEALPGRLRGQLVKLLERMLGHVARQRSRPSFGICASCAHLRSDERGRSDQCRYQCGLLNEPLAAEEIEQICISFEPGKTSAVRSISARKLTQ
jgi:DNA-binding MarR family transcriptional regulator